MKRMLSLAIVRPASKRGATHTVVKVEQPSKSFHLILTVSHPLSQLSQLFTDGNQMGHGGQSSQGIFEGLQGIAPILTFCGNIIGDRGSAS